MKFSKILAAVLLFSSSLFAQDLGEPVYVADQKRISSEAMKHEAEQFRQRANFRNAESQLASNLIRRDLLQKEFERTKELVSKGQATESQLQSAQQTYQNSEDAVARNRSDVEKSKMAALVAKYRVLEIGNPGLDHRRSIASAMLSSARQEKQSLENSLGNARLTEGYFKKRFENGKYLLDRQAISMQDFERRELELRSSRDVVRGIEFQISGLQDIAEGLEKTIKKFPSLN